MLATCRKPRLVGSTVHTITEANIVPGWFKVYVSVCVALLYVEMVVGTCLTVHLPPQPEPWFTQPPGIIIPRAPNPYENDCWIDCWDEYLI